MNYGLDARRFFNVDAGIMGLPELDQMMKTNLNAKGMILDMRKYRDGTLWKYLENTFILNQLHLCGIPLIRRNFRVTLVLI
mgnify:FL=1